MKKLGRRFWTFKAAARTTKAFLRKRLKFFDLRHIVRPTADIKALQREILLGFWKAHILHYAAEGPVVAQWMLQELRHNGYEVSPGTIYPLLARLEEHSWLKCKTDPGGGLRARKEYSLTKNGREVVTHLREQIRELHRELLRGEDEGKNRQ